MPVNTDRPQAVTEALADAVQRHAVAGQPALVAAAVDIVTAPLAEKLSVLEATARAEARADMIHQPEQIAELPHEVSPLSIRLTQTIHRLRLTGATRM